MGRPKIRYSTVTHDAIGGRIRVRVRGLARDDVLTKNIAYDVGSQAGVVGVSGNALTGTLLIEFTSATSQSEICRFIDTTMYELVHDLSARADPADYREAMDEWFRDRRRYRGAHVKEVDEVIGDLQTDKHKGLQEREAALRLIKKGVNVIPHALPESGVKTFSDQLANVPAAVLGASAVLSILTGGMGDALLIGAVLLANSTIGYKVVGDARKSFAKLTLDRADLDVGVIRSNRTRSVDATTLVPGDVVLVRSGPVPSDMRLIEANGLSVNESILTGESMPVEKDSAVLPARPTDLGERQNLLFKGSSISRGSGKAVVINTGAGTELGFISEASNRSQNEKTSSLEQLETLNELALKASLPICGGAFFIALLQGRGVLSATKLLVALSVASIPEGLPMIGTICLSNGARRVRRRGINVASIAAMDRLCQIDTVCFDKTGTLTLNRMKVAVLLMDEQAAECRGVESLQSVSSLNAVQKSRLQYIFSVCTEYAVYHRQNPPSGTEEALVSFAGEIDNEPKIVDYQLREVSKNYMSVTVKDGRSLLTLIKGNPHTVLGKCHELLNSDGNVIKLTKDKKARLSRKLDTMARSGLRVLGLAASKGSQRKAAWQWVGAVGLEDPLRAGASDWVRDFHDLGIEACVITGDQKETAEAIIGQLKDGHGRRLEDNIKLFSRVSPKQKRDIIADLKRQGRKVMMVGDGMNDAPAIAKSDLGVALLQKDATFNLNIGDAFIEPQNLGQLAHTVRMGRSLRHHQNNSIRFIISTNLAELVSSFVGIVFGAQSTFSAKQLLWINLLTDVFPAMALALQEDNDQAAMTDPQPDDVMSRRKNWLSIGDGTIMASGILATMVALRYATGDAGKARAGALVALVWGQMLQALRMGGYSPSDLWWRPNQIDSGLRNSVILLSTSAVLGCTVPGLSRILGNSVLQPRDLMWPMLGAAVQFGGFKVVDEWNNRQH